MKTKILKLSSLLFAIISLFILSFTNAYAASSIYSIAPMITFSSDMNIDEGFDLIKPFILYQDGQPCTSYYTFNYERLDSGWYRYYGTYPDGSTFSIQTGITTIDNASGTYVSALMTKDYYRQSIYVKDLKPGKTTNDCLLECWRDKFVSIKEPTYSIYDQPTQNIYTRMTSFETAAGTFNLMYYAVIENVNYTPDENPEDNANNNTENPGINDNNPTDDPSLNDPIIPDDGEDDNGNQNQNPPQTGEDNNNDNNQNNDNSNNNNNDNNNQQPNNPNDQQPQDPSDNTDVKDDSSQIKTILILTGSVVGIGLIYLLYLVFKAIIVWLKR